MKNQKIVFTVQFGHEHLAEEYYPVPAIKMVPEWYKVMETSYAEDKKNVREVHIKQTIKRCMPVFDAITAGYILKLYTDLTIDRTDDGLKFEWSFDTKDTITWHPAYQLLNYRNLDLPQGAPKLGNPWGIKTPKGYSCLFIPPVHRPSCGIRILEGFVDTDKYENSVQFPFLVDDGFTGTIPAGTPIAQVIPFKRDSFRMELGGIEERTALDKIGKLTRSVWINGYRNKFRTKKEYL